MRPTKELFGSSYERKPSNLPKKSRYERKPVLIKLLTLFNYWSNQMEKLLLLLKSPYSHD